MKRYISLWILTICFCSLGQELPPIMKFSPTTYKAGNQNWMISQDKNKFLFFANNEGLLEHNGTDWLLYPTPNETIIRSVKVIQDKIYTGCYMDFGYWKRASNGILEYTSLTPKIKSKILDDEQFWNILEFGKWVVFQSLNQIFIYNTQTENFQIVNPKNPIFKAYVVDKSIYFQTVSNGLFEIENGKSKLVSKETFFIQNKIVALLKKSNSLLIVTQFNGIYEYKDKSVQKWITDSDSNLNESSIYCAQKSSTNGIILGTVSNGIFIIDSNGKTEYHITQNKGISNNTALSLFEDGEQNLWVGLDNGINCINLASPIRSYSDETGILGTVYCSALYQNNLYIGTNQGLFYKRTGEDSFQFITGTKGQVWSLFVHDNTLLCGHDAGTFQIVNNKALPIFNESGTWKFEVKLENPNQIVQGNYYGLSLLERINGRWVFKNKINGFDYSSKYFEWLSKNEILVSHEYKGIFKLKINPENSKVIQFETFQSPNKGKNAGLTKYNNKIYYCNKEGFYVFNPSKNSFFRDVKLSKITENNEYISGKLMPDNSNRLWFFSRNYINYFSFGKLTPELEHHAIPIPSSLTNSMLGYENITQLSDSQYLIGTTDGYYSINIDELTFNNYLVHLTNISTNKQNESLISIPLATDGNFKFDENNFTFSYTVPEYNKYIMAEFQYLLKGVQNEWSEWSGKSTVNFKNLQPGTYTFSVRAKIGNSVTENTEKYTFTILKPWYLTNTALVIYTILLLIMAYFINKAYQKYYYKQQEKLIEENNRLLEIKELETEQELMRIKNQQLEQDFENKNKELAASTMSLIKKNELLAMIKDDLKNSESGSKNLKSVISTINKNINEEDTWNVFVDAFNNADKDFLKKIKHAHPSLTPNDLRLTAYLRLNLSSKEIAPLLNISVRSVEIKRYRLRKKMDLPHEKGLVEYILSI